MGADSDRGHASLRMEGAIGVGLRQDPRDGRASPTHTVAAGQWAPSVERIGLMDLKARMLYLQSIASDPPLIVPIPGIGGDEFVAAVFEQYRSLAQVVRTTCIELGVDVDAGVQIAGERVPVFDFGLPTYAAHVAGEIRLLRSWESLRPSITTVMPRTIAVAVGDFDWAGLIVRNLVDLLVLAGLGKAVLEVLDGIENWANFLKALKDRQWGKAARNAGQVPSYLASGAGARALAAKAGEEAASKAIGKIAAKTLPIVGWALFLGDLLASIVAQIEEGVWGMSLPPTGSKGRGGQGMRPATVPGGEHGGRTMPAFSPG